ncbi:MAG: inositol monophosphatase, partial [Microcystis aeruginosa]
METFWSQVLDFCYQATSQFGDRLLADFGKLQAINKADGTLVTAA